MSISISFQNVMKRKDWESSGPLSKETCKFWPSTLNPSVLNYPKAINTIKKSLNRGLRVQIVY